jgi:WD40 repeat protein
LIISDYTRLGGVKEALENHANKVYESLSTEEQLAAKLIFLELTRLDAETEDTRKQVRQQDLVNSQQSEALVHQVVQHLAKEKLVVTGEQELEGKRVAVVNIAHEALIRNWQMLRDWLKENRDALLRKQDIEDAAKEWRDKGKLKDSAYLLQGSRLTEAENFQQKYADTVPLSGVAQEFVQESIKERQKNRRILALGGVVGVIVLMFAGVAGVQWRNAEGQRQIIFARRLANQADLTRDQRPELLQRSVLLAVEAMKRSPSPEAYEVLRHGLSLLPRPIKSLKHKSGVDDVVFSPDGRYMATNAIQDSVRVWEVTSGKEVARLQSAWKIAFSPDSKYLVTASKNIAQVWAFTNGKEVTRMTHEDMIGDIAFSPDGKYLATASWDNTARVWKVSTGQEIARMKHDARLSVVAFSPNGKYIATAVDAKERIYGEDFLKTHPATQVWEATTGKEVARIKHDKPVNAISFSRDGKYLATASGDNTARMSEVATGRPVASMAHPGSVWDVAFSPDGKYLATACQDQKARVWNTTNGTTITLMAHKEIVQTVAFSPDGKYLATVTYPTRFTGEMDTSEHSALLWEVISGREVARMTHNDDVENIAFSPDGKYLATASQDGTVGVWEAISNRTTVFMTHDNYWSVYAVAFSPDGKYFATVSGRVDRSSMLRPHKIRVWEASSGRELAQIQDKEEKVTNLTFSPNGKYLSAVSYYGKPRMWEVTSGKEVTPIAQNHWGTNPAFTPDGKYKATAEGKFVYVREVKSGQEVARITHNENVDAVAFSPDGKYLAMTSGFITSESGDSRAWVSLWRPEELMTEACTRLTRNLRQEEWQQYLPNEPYRKTCPNLP